MSYLVVASLAAAFLAGLLAYHLAGRKGRNRKVWMVASVFLLVPVLMLAILPTKHGQAQP